MTDDPVASIARAVAIHLNTDVETELCQRSGRPTHYADPVGIAGLIVAIATLAWTIYIDLKKSTPQPPAETVARKVRLKVSETRTVDGSVKHVIELTAEETIRRG